MLLMCPQCQAKAQAKCDCGVGYVPAGDLARREVIRNPQKSDRAIAKQLGIAKDTVRRARTSTGANAPVEKRQGRDGKMRRMPINVHQAAQRKLPKYPGFERLKTAWFMATREETEMFLEWVKHQRERKSCNVVELQRTAAQSG